MMGSGNINMQIFAAFRKGAPVAGFGPGPNWKQRDGSRQGTMVVNLPE